MGVRGFKYKSQVQQPTCLFLRHIARVRSDIRPHEDDILIIHQLRVVADMEVGWRCGPHAVTERGTHGAA